MNIELLEKVKQHITEEPRRFIMGRWKITAEPGAWLSGLEVKIDGKRRKAPACGTAACIAGWTCLIGSPDKNINLAGVQEHAESLLGISKEQAFNLFWVSRWPKYWRDKWFATRSLPERSRIAGRVIDRFIKTNQ